MASLSELFENFFRFLGIVADDRQLDEVIRDAGYVKRLEVDSRLAESVRHVGQQSGLVFEQNEMDFALRESDVRCLKSASRHYDIVRENVRHRYSAEGYCREGLDVDAASGERLRHSAKVSGVIRELDRAVFH